MNVRAPRPADSCSQIAMWKLLIEIPMKKHKSIVHSRNLSQRILALVPEHVGALCNYGNLKYMAMNDYGEAESLLRQALKADPSNLSARMQLDVVRTLRISSGDIPPRSFPPISQGTSRPGMPSASSTPIHVGKPMYDVSQEAPRDTAQSTTAGGRQSGSENPVAAKRFPVPCFEGEQAAAAQEAMLAPDRWGVPEATPISLKPASKQEGTGSDRWVEMKARQSNDEAIQYGIDDLSVTRNARRASPPSAAATACETVTSGRGEADEDDALDKAVKMFREPGEPGDPPEECPGSVPEMLSDKRWNVRVYGYEVLGSSLARGAGNEGVQDVVSAISKGLGDVNVPAQVRGCVERESSVLLPMCAC